MEINTKATMKARMQQLQDELAVIDAEGQAAAGLVKFTLNGKAGIRRVQIAESLMQPDGARMLEDLIVVAFRDAQSKLEAAVQARVQALTGGLT